MSPVPHVYVVEAGDGRARAPLVLLHGSYGTESDLLPMARRVAPGASLVGVRGSVAMDDRYAFFRRLPDRRVDEADLRARIPVLAILLRELAARRQLAGPPVLVGFSNGAIMGAALVATYPELLAGAILFRPLSPFSDDESYRSGTVPVLIVDAAWDLRRSPGDGRRLADRLEGAGAVLTHRVLPGGHAIGAEDEDVARGWLETLQRPG